MDHEMEIEVFRAGDYGPRGRYSEEDLERIAADYDPEGLISVPRSEFPPDAEIVPGDWIAVSVSDEGDAEEELEMRVVEISPEAVVLDANHPLSGRDIRYKLVLLDIV